MRSAMTVLAGVLITMSAALYGHAILYKGAKPVKASWIIWVIVNILLLLGMREKHAVNGQIVASAIGASIILILAFLYSPLAWKPLHTYCVASAAIGVVLWKIFDNSIPGILANLVADSIGCWPTFESAWKYPEREDKLTWKIGWLGCLCALFAIPHWTWEDAAQPIVYFMNQSITTAILLIRSRVIRHAVPSP